MELNFDKRFFEISSSNVVTGIISLKIDEEIFFPERDWNDSIVLILISWMENTIQIRKDKLREMKFYFFDGPFTFELIEKQELTYLELFHGDKTISKHHVNFDSFENNLLKCCEEVISEIDKRDWVTPETIKLKLLFKELVSL